MEEKASRPLLDLGRSISRRELLVGAGALAGGLAESVTQDTPTQWTIRLKQGIEFSNGKKLSSDDVIYSFQRILTPGLGLFGHSGLSKSVDPKNIQKMDDRTVRLNLIQADSTIDAQLGQYYNGIVPVGYDKYPSPQIGTGPYTLG